MTTHFAPSRLALLGLALAAAGCTGPAPEARLVAEPLEASPWVGAGRRPALRAASPADPLLVPVPVGARRAVLRVTALRDGWPPFRRSARVEARVGPSGPSAGAEVAVRTAVGAAWHELVLDLPPGARELELRARPGGADRIWWARPHWEGPAPPGARNVLLVSLDTVRADAVGHLGQALATSPHLDALAARGTTWTEAIAPSSWTLPAHLSIMTGVYPSWHGHTALDRRHGPPLPTLAGLLGEAGWETAAFTGEGFISFTYGATRDFGLVVEHPHTRIRRWWRPDDVPEALVGAAGAVSWLRARQARGAASPFFLFWHTYEPHSPYTDERFVGTATPLPPGVPESARADWQRYLGDLAVADRALGGILEALEQLGLSETTDVLVFSDHGEEFGEHSGGRLGRGLRHGHGSWDTLLRVPLVAASAGIAPGRRPEQVSLVDLFPTVLASAGLSAPPCHGRALQVPGGHRSVGAEALSTQWAENEEKAWRRSDGLKYVARLAEPPQEGLWDVRADPLEQRDLSESRPAELAALRAEALDFFGSAPAEWAARARRAPAQAPADLPPAVLESLRSLGYVE
jgi:arylsulfatase A-like enzyme